MVSIRKADEDELAALRAFDNEFAGSDATMEEFQRWFAATPELFVVCRSEEDLLAAATGRPGRPEENPIDDRPDGVVLQSIAVRPSHQGEGLGRRVLEYFEQQAVAYADLVGMAAAPNVESFYRRCGYEPSMILLQVTKANLPPDYDAIDGFLGERTPSPGTRFLYVGFEDYEPAVRENLAAQVNAFQANTIFEKTLSDDGGETR